MKLLFQSDDFGITKAVSSGIIEGIKNGIIRNTGLFANMPWAEECVELIKPYLSKIAFGLDLNISTGPALLSSKEIPNLVQKNGDFLTSSMHRALDNEENNFDHVTYEEVYKEFEAQINKYIALVGKKPDYLHGHAYGSATVRKVSLDLSSKYNIPYSVHFLKDKKVKMPGMAWYKNPPTLENQVDSSLESFLLEDNGHILDEDISAVICHCGYADAELMRLSSFNLYRIKDLQAATSDDVKQWIKDNKIELITYNDIK